MSHVYDRKRRVAVIGISVFLLLAMVIAVIVGILTTDTDDDDDSDMPDAAHAKRAIEAFCRPTHYKKECVNSLNAAKVKDMDDPTQLAAEAFNLTRAEIALALNRTASIEALVGNDTRGQYALDICRQVAKIAVWDLQRAEMSFVERFGKGDFDLFTEDLRAWTGGALTLQDVCLDSFDNATAKAGEKMRALLLKSRELIANALAIIVEVDGTWKSRLEHEENEAEAKDENESESDKEEDNENEPRKENKKDNEKENGAGNEKEKENEGEGGGQGGRRLLSVPLAGDVPEWVGDQKRSIMAMSLADIKADVVVAKDGSGMVSTLRQALHLVPKKSQDAFVILVKEGVYREHVTVNGRMTSIILVGEGPTKTIISGAKSFADGFPTYMTSTIDIDGDGFMARDIGFENTAGPTKNQAVAARVSSDYAVFYNCHFSGFQNTLYAVRARQFYRDCTISGTVDFVSGDAIAVFQNCLLLLRTPLPGQTSSVTAQARSDVNAPGAMIFQNCTITSEPGPDLVQAQPQAFLGRPVKPYSRTIIMQSFIDKAIAPEGWTPFSGQLGLKTSFYAEFMNKGPGSDLSGRVKWAGIKNLTIVQVGEFSPGKFFAGDDKWITNTGCPYYGNMLPTSN